MQVYADNAATTKMSRTAIEAMLPYMETVYGNPSSLHSVGQQAAEALAKARETVARLVDACCKRPDRILVPAAGGRRGSPCVFPKDLFPALLALRGDVGGRQVIRANPDRVLAVPVSPQVLYDVDTLRALEALGPG